MTPFVIPFFIPHQGCPHRCIFCNQQSITGFAADDACLTGRDVQAEITARLSQAENSGRQVQVAFYGGSFTGLDPRRQKELLGSVQPFIKNKKVDCIRLSTRPDYIDAGIVTFLQQHHVRIVELGVQSLDPKVLAASRRGHTVAQVEEAFVCLRRAGLTLGAQLMIGLPGETSRGVLAGARHLAGLQPDFIRIYPTLVIRGSGLARLHQQGHYHPLTMNRAVALCARIMPIFAKKNIRVVRVGIQPSLSLEKEVLAGPYHPSFGELVRARMLFNKARNLLNHVRQMKNVELSVASADQSVFRGKKNRNMNRLAGLGLLNGVTVRFDPGQARQTLALRGKK